MITEVTRYVIEGSETIYETREKAIKAYRKGRAMEFLAQDPTLDADLRGIAFFAEGRSVINTLMKNRRSIAHIFDIMDGLEDSA